MRLALIADLHANAVALDAVLAALATEPVDQIACLGDVAASGPQPRQTLSRLRALGCPTVLGNADAELLLPPPPPPAETAPETGTDPNPDPNPDPDDATRIAAIDRWCAAQLDPADRAFLRSFPPTVTLPLPGHGDLLACHGSPRSFDDPILADTPHHDLDPMLTGVAATIVAAGHTHLQLVRRYRSTILLNPGSVGLPYAPAPPALPAHNPPHAEYAILTADHRTLAIELRRIPIDLPALLAAAHDSAMPHAEWWCQGWGTSNTESG